MNRDAGAQLEDTRQQLEELRRSLADSRERTWKLESAELRCQELAEKVATLKQERDEMQQQQAALLERVDASNAANAGNATRPTHMLTLPPPPNPNRPVTDGGEWALREALAESEAERDELVHQLARARERFDLVNGIVGRSEQQVGVLQRVCMCQLPLCGRIHPPVIQLPYNWLASPRGCRARRWHCVTRATSKLTRLHTLLVG